MQLLFSQSQNIFTLSPFIFFFFLFSFFTLFYSIVDIKSYIFQHLVLVIELNSKFYDKDLLFMSRTLGDVIIN